MTVSPRTKASSLQTGHHEQNTGQVQSDKEAGGPQVTASPRTKASSSQTRKILCSVTEYGGGTVLGILVRDPR